MAPGADEDGGESESAGGLEDDPSSGGSSLEDEDEEAPELLGALSDSSESDLDELLLSTESLGAAAISDSVELSTAAGAFSASGLRDAPLRDRLPDAFTHLGYCTTGLRRANCREVDE